MRGEYDFRYEAKQGPCDPSGKCFKLRWWEVGRLKLPRSRLPNTRPKYCCTEWPIITYAVGLYLQSVRDGFSSDLQQQRVHGQQVVIGPHVKWPLQFPGACDDFVSSLKN